MHTERNLLLCVDKFQVGLQNLNDRLNKFVGEIFNFYTVDIADFHIRFFHIKVLSHLVLCCFEKPHLNIHHGYF